MPIYEYQCGKCGHVFDAIQKYSDDPLTDCPECGGTVERVVSTPAIQFKGSGFYITDYAKKSGTPGSGKAGKSGKSGKSGTSGKSTSD